MAYLIGISLALGVGAFATWTGFDRERSFYAVLVIIVGTLYGLFAVLGGGSALAAEAPGMVLFIALAVIGFRTTPWLIVAALAGHGLFDLIHPHVIDNPGVPAYWPAFCMSYDIAAAAYLAVRLWAATPALRGGVMRGASPTRRPPHCPRPAVLRYSPRRATGAEGG